MAVPPSPLLMAPMAGVTDAAFRQRLRRNGCRMLFTEMVSAAALSRGNRRTLRYLEVPDGGPDLGVQLFGAHPSELAEAARMVVDEGFETVDFNAGCPVKKVVRTGAGAALLRDLGLLERCLDALRLAVPGALSVKIRTGWDEGSRNYVQAGRVAENCGVDWVVLHGRSRAQLYSGRADWEAVAELAERLVVPVVGNGDVSCGEDAVERLGDAACRGVMIGRAALARPWLFRRGHQLLCGRKPEPPPTRKEVGEDLLLQLDDMVRWKGPRVGVTEARKFVAWAAKGRPGAAALRGALHSCNDETSLRDVIREFFFAPEQNGEVGGEQS